MARIMGDEFSGAFDTLTEREGGGVNHRHNHQIGQTLMGQSVTLWSTAELNIVMCSPCNFGKLSIYLQRET